MKAHERQGSSAATPDRIRLALGMAMLVIVAATAVEAADAAATAWIDTPQSRVRLTAGSDPVLPGARVVMLEMQLQPNWKTYWRMPGDAGIPPSFDWKGSQNVGNVEVRYPAPAIYVDKSGRTIGYKTAVTFPVVITPADPKAPSRINVEIAFGICREICIPVEAQLALDVLPDAVLPQGVLAEAMAKVPVRKDAKAASRGAVSLPSIALSGGSAAPKISVAAAGVETLLVEGPDGLFVPIPERIAGNEAAATFEIDLTKTQDLPDLKGKTLTFTAIGKTGSIETRWTMPAAL